MTYWQGWGVRYGQTRKGWSAMIVGLLGAPLCSHHHRKDRAHIEMSGTAFHRPLNWPGGSLARQIIFRPISIGSREELLKPSCRIRLQKMQVLITLQTVCLLQRGTHWACNTASSTAMQMARVRLVTF